MVARHRFFDSAVAVLAVFAVSVAACSDDDGSSESGPDVAAFCAAAPDPDVTVPASYVGSGENVADLRDLRARAPVELGDDLDLVIRHLDEAVDPSDPDSQLIGNYPDEVSAAIGRITTYIDQNCLE